jgi:hypothetical protein
VNNETKDVLNTEPTASTTATIKSYAGTYDISVSGGKALNYTFSYKSGQLTITSRNLNAYVGDYERAYGEDNPIFVITYEGFVNNDTEKSLNTKPSAKTNATKTSNVGTYDITLSGGYSPNYIFTYGQGKLTIVKAEQTFVWDQDLSNIEVGSQIELLAKASSGLPITYTMDSDEYAEIYKAGSKTYMECKKAGTFSIKAVQDGNDNYYPTQRINKSVTIVNEGEYNPTLFIKQGENGMVSTKVGKGTTHTFTFLAETGWKIHSVTFNDVDVTNQLYDGSTFTTPAITTNSILAVVYELDDIDEIRAINESNVTIQGTSYGARVIGANKGDMISICTTDGSLYHSVKAEQEVVDVPLRKDTVYIIKVGTKTIKLSH